MATKTALVLGQPIELENLKAEFARIKDARKSEGLVQRATASLLTILKPECMDCTVEEIARIAETHSDRSDTCTKHLALERKTLSTGRKDGVKETQVLQIGRFKVVDANFRVFPETYHILKDFEIYPHDSLTKMEFFVVTPCGGKPLRFFVSNSTSFKDILSRVCFILGLSPQVYESACTHGYLCFCGQRAKDYDTVGSLGVESGDYMGFFLNQQSGGMYHPT